MLTSSRGITSLTEQWFLFVQLYNDKFNFILNLYIYNSFYKTLHIGLLQIQSTECQCHSWGPVHWQQEGFWETAWVYWCPPWWVQVWTHQGRFNVVKNYICTWLKVALWLDVFLTLRCSSKLVFWVLLRRWEMKSWHLWSEWFRLSAALTSWGRSLWRWRRPGIFQNIDS